MNAKQQFLEWLKENDPYIYQVAVASATGGVGSTDPGFWGSIWNGVKTAAVSVAGAAKDVALNAAKAKAEMKIREKYFGGDKTVPISNEQVQAVSNAELQRIAHQAAINSSTVKDQLVRAEFGLPPKETPNYTPVNHVTNTPQQQAQIGVVAEKSKMQQYLIPAAIAGSVLLGVLLIKKLR